MMKDFRKKSKEQIKRLVKEKNLKLYTLRIRIRSCSEYDFVSAADFLLSFWTKMYRCRSAVFFKWFSGFTRELILEIDGNIITPYLYFVLFASRGKLPELSKLKNLAFFSVLKTAGITDAEDIEEILRNVITPVEEVEEGKYGEVLDNLMLPCIRIVQPNERLEELADLYQYNRQLCSRGGIVSRKKLERALSIEIQR